MQLPDDIASELWDKLWDLMHHREYNLNGPDSTRCMMCLNYANDIKGDSQAVIHEPDCLGNRILKLYD